MDPFDQLAEALRGRLIERARHGAAHADELEADVRGLVAAEAAALSDAERGRLVERVMRLATGLGPLDPLLSDGSVDEVMVNGAGSVWVERRWWWGRPDPPVGRPSPSRRCAC